MNDANEEISKLSDRDLTFEIAKVAYFGTRYNIIKNRNEILLTFKGSTVESLNYCNNWGDLLNAIEDSNLDYGVTQASTGWNACLSYSNDSWVSTAKTQKRALAECLYKVLLNIKQ